MPQPIIIVEDDQDWREALCEILVADGYQVSTSRDRDEAFALISEGERPSLIISDLMMPGMSAEVFYQGITKLGLGDVPIIVMSAANPTEVPTPPGVRERFPKPVDIDRLLGMVRSILDS